MSKQEQTNTFEDGIMTDMHPLSANNTTMTDALNATIVTYNGNEMILQNDMGNTTLTAKNGEVVRLSEGFKPLGVVEHGGILYIASYKQDDDKTLFELGSFPGPDFSNDEKDLIKTCIKGDPSNHTIVKDNLNTLDGNECDLYKILPLQTENGLQDCNLTVGQEFVIDVIKHQNLFGFQNPQDAHFYKVRFINLETGQDITDLLKFAVQYSDIYEEPSIYKYFPNIKNTKLGVRFEIEDIDIFDLGVLNITTYPEYNASRYPYFNESEWRIEFPTIEYKTSSDIKVSRFIIEYEFISKDKKGKHEKGCLRPIYFDSLDEKEGIYSLSNSINYINLPTGSKNYYFDYKIYPEWTDYIEKEERSENFTIFTRKHKDYNTLFGKWVIQNSIDLSISPSLWDSKGEYVAEDTFKQKRFLSYDYQFQSEEDDVKFKIGISIKNEQTQFFDFLKANYNGYLFPINNTLKEDSIEYIGCLNEGSQNFLDVFPNIEQEQYKAVGAFVSTQWGTPLGLYKVYYGGYDQKSCRIYNYIHRHYLKSKILENLKFYNTFTGSFHKDISIHLVAEKHAPMCLYGAAAFNFSEMSHIKTDKIALSPLQQHQELCIYDEKSEHDEIDILSTWKKLACPIAGSPTAAWYTNLSNKPSAWFGRDGKYNYNAQTDGNACYYLEDYEKQSDKSISLKEGSLNLNMQTNFLCLVGKQGRDDQGKYKDEWMQDINQDKSSVSSLFENSRIAPARVNLKDSDRATWKNLGSWIKGPGCYIRWRYDYNVDDSYIEVENDLKQNIQLALSKARIKDGETVYINNFNENFIKESPKYIKASSISEQEESFYVLCNSQNQVYGNSSMGIIAPYAIDVEHFNYREVVGNLTPEYTFTDLSDGFYNIRFYLKHAPYETHKFNIKIEGLSNYKIYIQDENSDYTKVNDVKFCNLYKDKFRLVQIIGKCDSRKIKITFSSSGNKLKYKHIVRNVMLFQQSTEDPYKTYAISTFYTNRILVNCKNFNTGYNITGGGLDFCYLPEPSYFIDSKISNFTSSKEGIAQFNNQTFDIITE